MEKINIVWLKRDLRTQDHAPLQAAEAAGIPYVILYLFEPQLMDYPDTSLRHLQFTYHSVLAINERLENYKREVTMAFGNAPEVLRFFVDNYAVQSVFSYRESGTKVTWDRDKAVRRMLKKCGVTWEEFQRDGILRGIEHRDGWDQQWYTFMHSSVILNEYTVDQGKWMAHPFELPEAFLQSLESYPDVFQPAGEQNGIRYLYSFVKQRGANYGRHISKPTESRLSCSRLSPFISWGNLSIRQVYQFVKWHPDFRRHKFAHEAFLDRLKWHCHFIQKFEVECEYETHCINRGYEQLPHDNRPDWLEAWKKGLTGYPLVDACMRCVMKTGWINFRMRAMLVSFLTHHLDIDWRKGVYHLAQQFLDFEPGIHFPQFQMQAGTTGVNMIRIYNPIKQSKEHDPHGHFIRKWLPELDRVPDAHLHEPWLLTAMEQQFYRFELGKDYPKPLVDLEESYGRARDKIWNHRKNELVRKEGKRILKRHTRRSR